MSVNGFKALANDRAHLVVQKLFWVHAATTLKNTIQMLESPNLFLG